MPDINLLRSSPAVYTQTYMHPREIPSSDVAIMRSDMRSNILLPFVDKVLLKEQQGKELAASGEQFWLGCYTRTGQSTSLEFFVSCTNGPIDKYPIFIYAVQPHNKLERGYLLSRMRCIVDSIMQLAPTSRVYSVFAMVPVAEAFTQLYSRISKVSRVREPYYAAMFSYCTRASFRNQELHRDIHRISIRQATLADVPRAAPLCYGFAEESAPFTLTPEKAMLESSILQREKQLWVLEISNEIASIVAVTREDRDTSAITKVYTSRQWRGQKLAECLVRGVCQRLLSNPEKKRVVLFVAHENTAAAKVYQRVGFVGLGVDEQVSHVEPWVEIGFDRSVVELGHW